MTRRALPFDVVVADPPWSFGDKLPGKTRGAGRHYETMPIHVLSPYLVRTGLESRIADDAVLFLWKVAAIPEWQVVCTNWGFKPVAELVWVKTTGVVQTQISSIEVDCVCVTGGFTRLAFGMGRRVRNCHEVCVIAQRGKPLPVADKAIRSVFFAPLREHSRKPDEFYRIVERIYPTANRLELFSREDRPGWTCTGRAKGMYK